MAGAADCGLWVLRGWTLCYLNIKTPLWALHTVLGYGIRGLYGTVITNLFKASRFCQQDDTANNVWNGKPCSKCSDSDLLVIAKHKHEDIKQSFRNKVLKTFPVLDKYRGLTAVLLWHFYSRNVKLAQKKNKSPNESSGCRIIIEWIKHTRLQGQLMRLWMFYWYLTLSF